MFKQQNQLFPQKQQNNLSQQNKQCYLSRNRNHHLGIKLITRSSEENKLNLRNEVNHADLKYHENISRNSSIKGIHVVSSRQSSHERRQLATSRSHERQIQSRQIKSQTNISSFEEKQRSKDGSMERRDQSVIVSDYQDLCLLFQNKFKQAIFKSNSVHQLQLDSLKEIISSNQERINNLITTINFMVEKSQKAVKETQKIKQRFQSIIKYQEQCHEYTLRRLQNLESIYLTIGEQIQKQISKSSLSYSNRFTYIELIIKNIIVAQQTIAKQQFNLACLELSQLHLTMNQIDLKANLLGSFKHSIKNVEIKQEAINQHIKQLNNNLIICKERLQLKNWPTQQEISLAEIQIKFNNELLNFQSRIKQLQKCRYALQSQYQSRQQKAERTIFELSTLLHKIQRQLETKRKEGEQLSRYNLQIENKLIQSRLKENSLRVEVDSFQRYLETSKKEEHDLLSKEKDVFKQKFEEMFKRNELLEGINCKNKYLLVQKQKQIASLQQKVDQENQQIARLINLNKLFAQNEQLIRKITYENNSLKFQKNTLKNQKKQLQDILTQKTMRVESLFLQKTKIQEQNYALKKSNQELLTKINSLNKQFHEEQLYSEHLQRENQQLENSLNDYKQVFENQSLLFRQTIQNLQNENIQLKNSLNAQLDKSNKSKFQPLISLKTHAIAKISLENFKLGKLKNELQKMQLTFPVLCEIDSCGYLKLYDQGTYLLDQQENPFQMTQEELRAAIQANIIKLFQ